MRYLVSLTGRKKKPHLNGLFRVDRNESDHLCHSAVVVDDGHLSIAFVSSGKSTHLFVAGVEDAGSVASTGDAIVDHQSQDDIHWVHVSILNALAGIAEFDVLGTSLTKAGSIAASVSSGTFWTLIQNVVFRTLLHFLLPGKSRNGILLLKEIDELLDSLWSLLRSQVDGPRSTEDITIEFREHILQLRNERLWVCPGLIQVLQHIFVKLGSLNARKVHE